MDWVFTHFFPPLLAQARYRLRRFLNGLYDPDDLVHEVWAICLPKLATLRPRDGRYTPVMLKFLSSTFLNRYNNLLEKHLAHCTAELSVREGCAHTNPTDRAAEVTGVVARVSRNEAIQRILAALDALSESSREVFILRGVEQLDYATIANRTGLSVSAATVRFHRSLQKLRGVLPESMVDELAESPG